MVTRGQGVVHPPRVTVTRAHLPPRGYAARVGLSDPLNLSTFWRSHFLSANGVRPYHLVWCN